MPTDTSTTNGTAEFDALVIGSGAGGGMAALRLCEQGFKVGLIERGPRFDPKKDYIQNYPDWGLRDDPLDYARQKEQTIDRRYRTEFQHNGKTLQRSANTYHRVYGLGGSTLHYQGEAHRFAEHAFNNQSEFGWGSDWPINYADLATYYQQAEQYLGVAGETGNPHKPDREAYPCEAHALSQRSQLLKPAAERAGWQMLPNPLALPSKSLDGRLPCQRSGGCNFGCVFAAKSSIDQAIIPRAEATGNLTILTDTRATRLSTDQNGEITGVQCISRNGKATYTARRYVLAMGAVETPRLMLTSNNFANQHDQVGRYFMETLVSRLHLQVDKSQLANIKLYEGPPLDSRIWDFCKPEDDRLSGFVLGSSGYLYPGNDPIRHAISTSGIGRTHKQAARTTFGDEIVLFGIAEQEPHPDNRIMLTTEDDEQNTSNAFRVPKVKVHCAYSERDINTLNAMTDKLRDWASNVDIAKPVHRSTTLHQSSATHVGGTCRMGNDPAASVVDASGKVHGKSNCYITDASVFVSQGNGDSPSLTIQALALRTADRISADLKR